VRAWKKNGFHNLQSLAVFIKLLYNCKGATYLIVKKQEGGITWFQNWKLRYHLMHCSVCRSFATQSVLINKALTRFANSLHHETPQRKLTDQSKVRIAAAMRKEIDQT
jgi:hypothetical protein